RLACLRVGNPDNRIRQSFRARLDERRNGRSADSLIRGDLSRIDRRDALELDRPSDRAHGTQGAGCIPTAAELNLAGGRTFGPVSCSLRGCLNFWRWVVRAATDDSESEQ